MAKSVKKTKNRTGPKAHRAGPPASRARESGKGAGPKAQPSARPEPPAREPGTRPVFLRGFFAGAGAAMTLSMIVTMLAFAFTDPFGSGSRGTPAAGAERPAAGAIIEAEVEPTGRLALTVRAKLADRRYQPIKGARPVVTLDMIQMPQAHRTKPVALTPVAGSPGTYQAKLVAPMTGDFDVTVGLTAPLQGEAHTRISLPARTGERS